MPRAIAMALLMMTGLGCSGSGDSGNQAAAAEVELTWLGVTHWLVQYRGRTILLDAYLSRPEPGLTTPTEEGLDRMQRVLDAAGADSIDLILVGHSHFDHAVDCGAVAMRTGAQVIGTETTCLLALAEGLPAERCTVVGNDDGVDLEGVSVRAVRTIHTFPEGIGKYDELDEEPTNVWNVPHGGVVSFLVTFQEETPFSLFFQSSMAPIDGDDGSGEDYPANFDAVFGDVEETMLWLAPVGFSSDEGDLGAYYSRVKPRFVVPHHWDGLVPDIEAGVMTSFEASDAVLGATDTAGATLVPPEQYFDRFVLTADGVVRSDDAPVQDAFGL